MHIFLIIIAILFSLYLIGFIGTFIWLRKASDAFSLALKWPIVLLMCLIGISQ